MKFKIIDKYARLILEVLCFVLLSSMILFTCYTIIMRYVFANPPFWGDTLTLFANIWLVMLALVLAVRDRSHIAMELVYEKLPPILVIFLRSVWTSIIVVFGMILVGYGYIAATSVTGAFWELGNLPKTYPMMILPIAGFLMVLAGIVVFVEDIIRFRGDPFAKERGITQDEGRF